MSASVRKSIVAAAAAGTLMAAGIATASTASKPPTGTYRDGPLVASFSAPTVHPNCKQKWPVTVKATLNGKPAHATAYYEFVFKGVVESKQYPYSSTSKNPHNHLWSFTGGFTDGTFGPLGATAVGIPLNVRAVITDDKYTAYPGLNITVVKVSGCVAIH